VLVVVCSLAIAAVFWGWLVADPDIDVFMLDAGPVDRLAIGEVAAFEQFDVYVVGLANGRVRAIDGIVRANRCAIRWLPDDQRALSLNPLGRPGAFADRCSDALWAITGDAVSGTSDPLRTFQVTFRRDEAGVQHVQVEVIGRATPAGSAGE
jgi:hypothetical protein